MTELHLPYPPSANGLWSRTKTGMRKSNQYEAWLWAAHDAGKKQKPQAVHGPYKLSLQAVRPDKRKRDLDNLLKATSDVLMSLGVIEDDSACEMIVARWVTAGEGIVVRVEPAGIE